MRFSILAVSAILILSAMPAEAQRRTEQITCFRDRNTINCPNYGSFNIRNDNSRYYNDNRNDNRRYDDDNYRVPGDNRRNRYDDNSGLRTINEIYFQVLGRRVDIGGARTYIKSLNDGWTLDRVRNDIAYSGEAEQAINQAYNDILRRNADPGGLETYKRYLASGRSIADVRRELARSSEARIR
jgi:hypothetical protein